MLFAVASMFPFSFLPSLCLCIHIFSSFSFSFFPFSSLSVLSGQHDGDASGRSKQSRSEKKSRKAMLKLGMKPIPGVSRVTVKKSKNVGAF